MYILLSRVDSESELWQQKKNFFVRIKGNMLIGVYILLKKIVYPPGTKGRLAVQTKPTSLARTPEGL